VPKTDAIAAGDGERVFPSGGVDAVVKPDNVLISLPVNPRCRKGPHNLWKTRRIKNVTEGLQGWNRPDSIE